MRIRKRRLISVAAATVVASSASLDADAAALPAVAASANPPTLLVSCQTASTLALCRLLVGLSDDTSESFPTSLLSGERLQLDTTDDGSHPPIQPRSIGSFADESEHSETASGEISTTYVSGSSLGSHCIRRSISAPTSPGHGVEALCSCPIQGNQERDYYGKHATSSSISSPKVLPLDTILSSEGGVKSCSSDSRSLQVSLGLKKQKKREPYDNLEQGRKKIFNDDSTSVQSELGYGGKEAARDPEYAGEERKFENIRKRRRSVRHNSYTAVPVSSFKGVARRSRFIVSRQTARSGGWGAKESLCWVLQLMVSEAGREGMTVADTVRRLVEQGYSELFRADGVPRSVQVGKALRANPHVLELQNGRFVQLENPRKEAGREARLEEGELSKRAKKVIKEDEASCKLQQCNRKDGRGWQCSRRVKEGYTYCEHHLVKIKANHARSAMKLARMRREGLWNSCSGVGGKAIKYEEEKRNKKKKKRMRKRRYFKSLQEIENGGCLGRKREEKEEEEEEEEVWRKKGGPMKCLLNSNPTEWRSDLF